MRLATAFLISLVSVHAALAQTPPTASEAFALRIKCKEMADEKASSLWQTNPLLKNQPEVILRYTKPRYDAKANRCYIEVFDHYKTVGPKPIHMQQHQIYDAQVDELLAFAQIEDGKKVGMVFEKGHIRKSDTNLGWDDADAYIDEMMTDKR